MAAASKEMVKDQHMSASDELRTKLTCPICYEFFKRTFQCLNGHAICDTCFHKKTDTKCPICRVTYHIPYLKSKKIEKLMALVDVNCKFPGCDTTVRLSELAKHEEECEFNNELRCPFFLKLAENAVDQKCHGYFTTDEVISHLIQVHQSVLDTSSAELILANIGTFEMSKVVKLPDQKPFFLSLCADRNTFCIEIVMLDNSKKFLMASILVKGKNYEQRLGNPPSSDLTRGLQSMWRFGFDRNEIEKRIRFLPGCDSFNLQVRITAELHVSR